LAGLTSDFVAKLPRSGHSDVTGLDVFWIQRIFGHTAIIAGCFAPLHRRLTELAS